MSKNIKTKDKNSEEIKTSLYDRLSPKPLPQGSWSEIDDYYMRGVTDSPIVSKTYAAELIVGKLSNMAESLSVKISEILSYPIIGNKEAWKSARTKERLKGWIQYLQSLYDEKPVY